MSTRSDVVNIRLEVFLRGIYPQGGASTVFAVACLRLVVGRLVAALTAARARLDIGKFSTSAISKQMPRCRIDVSWPEVHSTT